MSKLSEEDIKIFIKEYYKLKNIQNSIKEIDKDFFFNLVDGLLDLYQKEKEKNKELDKIKFIITDNLPPDMKYVCYCNTDFERLFGNDYISKDKIREKIEKIKELESIFYRLEDDLSMDANKYDTINELDIQIDILEELLEEGIKYGYI